METKRIAYKYAKRHLKVFPLIPATKHPLTVHGFLDATSDYRQIRDWWRDHPDANVAIATGETSGILVLDSDDYKDGGQSLEDLESQHGKLPLTPLVLTPRGGRQFCFRHPFGHDIRNSTSAIGFALDIRANGGYVAAPPSVFFDPATKQLGSYRWELTSSLFDIPLADVPTWLLTMLLSKATTKSSSPFVPPATFENGRRNDLLFRTGCSMRAKYQWAEAQLLDHLRVVNHHQCAPPLDDDEVEAILHSVMRYSDKA